MRNLIRPVGVGLILAGLLLGAFAVYRNWQQDQANRDYGQAQHDLRAQLSQPRTGYDSPAVSEGTPAPASGPRDGAALAVLRVPRFGAGYHPVVVEGVSPNDLAKGPGHYPGTALPGDVGNFAVAGHRTGWGQPFNRLDELVRGDALVVQWQGRSYTYRVTATKTVEPTDVGVVLPVPNRPGAEPDKARITLTTCTDRDPVTRAYTHRLVVWGELERG
ncbi:class E sortase [Streptomyces sp. MUM 2J]|uniref:class E sortase n=1 Tax=Streptomyces sp. MUM 2J TaxID=2791987 RepID=UPI001F0444C1|nr:class E sortase [Streptomyces sp. MUM 2J]MCH0565953.1 class E sortase [Streptomyces sp. MUM 2J]